MLKPESVAALTNTLFFANANQAATPLVDEAVRNDPDIYPPARCASGCLPTAAWPWPTCASVTACGRPFAAASN